MFAYLIRRLLLMVPVVVGVLTLVFLIRTLVPGDPIEIMFLGEIPPDPEVVAEIRHQLGLDVPLPMQYVNYLVGVTRVIWASRSVRAAPFWTKSAIAIPIH